VGSSYVQLDRLTTLAFGAAVPVGLLATALLVVNNLRDIPTDARSGKRTLAVRLGDSATRALYVALVIGAFAIVPLVALRRPWALVALVALAVASRPLRRIADGTSGMGLIAVLGETARLQLAFGALLALGLAVSG
jgi:1,4-dihydroxy-2-naphthoate octaprenyltransferase